LNISFGQPRYHLARSLLKYIPDEIVILRELRKIVMASAMYPDQRDPPRIDPLQLLAVPDRNEPVLCSMDDVYRAGYFLYPLIGAQMIAKHIPDGKHRQKSFDHFAEIIIGCVQDEVPGPVVRSYFGGETTPQAAAIHDQVVLCILARQAAVDKLRIAQHFRFAPLARALSKAPVVHQYDIIIITVKIPGILCPPFDAPGIAVEIEQKPPRLLAVKMQAVDADILRHVEIHFPERNIVLELEIGMKLFRLEYEKLLQEIDAQENEDQTTDDIIEDTGQAERLVNSE
jgi:hypothetical protein